MCKTLNELLQVMADKHMSDKNLINNIFVPINALKKPNSFAICYGNIEEILQRIDNLNQVGILSRVEITDYDACVDKSLHHDRKQNWFDYLISLRAQEEDLPEDGNESILEHRGQLDLGNLMKRKNSNRTVEASMLILYEYLKNELLIVQAQKDIEVRKKEAKKAEEFFQEEDTTSIFYWQASNRGGRGRGQPEAMMIEEVQEEDIGQMEVYKRNQ